MGVFGARKTPAGKETVYQQKCILIEEPVHSFIAVGVSLSCVCFIELLKRYIYKKSKQINGTFSLIWSGRCVILY